MTRSRLPKIEYTTVGGLVTKANPHLVGANGMVTCSNMDTFKEYGSLSRVPGSTRVSDGAGSGWKSLHFYEHYNLAGTLNRHVIGLAGTTLYKINTDKTLLGLQTGLVSETLTGVVTQDRLHLTSPSNDPLKVDAGGYVTRWGVTPPGGEKTLLESFDDSTDWTGTDCTASNAAGFDSVDGSVAVAKSNVSVTEVTIEKTSGFGVETLTRYNYISIFIPEGTLGKLYQIDIELGSAGLPFGLPLIWVIDAGDLVEGRNLIELDQMDATLGGGSLTAPATGLALSDALIRVYTRHAADTFSDLRFDDLYAADQGYVDTAISATAGTIDGDVTYRVTYVSRYGQESNGGTTSEAITTATEAVDLSNIPISPDPQVVARRIYRDQDGDFIWRFVTQIDDNSTTTYTDTDGFAALSDELVPQAGLSAADFSRPRKMKQVISWQGFTLGIDAIVPSGVNFSYKNRPEAWPITRRVGFDFTVTALIPTVLGVEINGKDRCVLLKGTDWSNFQYEEVAPEQSVGCSGWRSWCQFKGGAAKWHDVGPYADYVLEPWYIGNGIKDQIEDLDGSLFEDLFVGHDRRNFRILFFTGTNHRTIYSWGYGRHIEGVISPEGSGVDPLDLRRGSFRSLTLDTGINPTCVAIVERPGDKPELWMGADDGYVYWLGDPDSKVWANGMDTNAITSDVEWEWTEHPQGVDMIARFVDLSIKSTAESVWTWTVSAAEDIEGTANYSATGTVTVNGVHESVTPIPAGVQGPYIKLRLQNSGLGNDGIIRRACVQIVPRREQREE